MKLFRLLILTIFAVTLIACGGADERKAVYLEKAKVSIAAGDLDKARIELKNVLQIDPKDAEAYYQLGNVYEELKDYRKAYANYKKSEELNPELLENQAKLGQFYLYLIKDNEKAQEKIDFILLKDPKNSAGLLLKAAMLLRNEDKAGATAIAEDLAKNDPGNAEVSAFLATIYMASDNDEGAIKVLEAALASNKDNEKLSKLLALVSVKNKDYARAESIYKAFLEKNPDNADSYNVLAAFYNTTGDENKAEQILRDSIENSPDDFNRYIVLIKFISVKDGNKKAIEELKEMVANNKGFGKLRIALAEYLYINNKKDAAIDVYIEAIKDFSEEGVGVDSRATLASIYLSDKEYDKADLMLAQAIEISPNDPRVNLLVAKLALINKDSEKAIISLRIVVKETPENIDAYVLLASAYQLEGNDEQVKSIMNTAYVNNKSNPEALLKLSELYLKRDVYLSEKIIDDYNKLKDSDYQGLTIKAAILNGKKEYSEAHVLAEKLMEKFPDKANGYIQALPYYTNSNNSKKIISTLEKGYASAKDNRKILMLLTALQVKEKKFDVVEKRIKAEIEAAPKDAILVTLLAKVYMTNNDTEAASSLLTDLVKKKTTLEDVYIMLSQIYTDQKDVVATTEVLEKGVENVKSSTKISLRLATMYEFNKEFSKAIVLYRKLYESDPDNLLVVNNLVSLQSDYDDNENKLEDSKALVEQLKESKNKAFRDTIGWFYHKTGANEEAIVVLKEAVAEYPDVNLLNYHLGMAYKAIGDKANAELYLKKSLSDEKPFNEKALAEAALKNI